MKKAPLSQSTAALQLRGGQPVNDLSPSILPVDALLLETAVMFA